MGLTRVYSESNPGAKSFRVTERKTLPTFNPLRLLPDSKSFARTVSSARSDDIQADEKKEEIEDVLIFWALPYARRILSHPLWRAPLVSLEFCNRFHQETTKEVEKKDKKRAKSLKNNLLGKMIKLIGNVKTKQFVEKAHESDITENEWVFAMVTYSSYLTGQGSYQISHVMKWAEINIDWNSVDRQELFRRWNMNAGIFTASNVGATWMEFILAHLNSQYQL
jgi:hypothetical protein